jgi:hypothetical protein
MFVSDMTQCIFEAIRVRLSQAAQVSVEISAELRLRRAFRNKPFAEHLQFSSLAEPTHVFGGL